MAVHAALAGEALQARPAPVPARTGEPGQDGPSQASQDPGRTAPGFLAGVRSVEFHVLRLDDVAGELMCDATRVAGDRGTALYEFELSSQTVKLLGGRATVIIGAREQKQS
jgi:predicted hotdog family 3-hydroxylacyl-ACP dehydratase